MENHNYSPEKFSILYIIYYVKTMLLEKITMKTVYLTAYNYIFACMNTWKNIFQNKNTKKLISFFGI